MTCPARLASTTRPPSPRTASSFGRGLPSIIRRRGPPAARPPRRLLTPFWNAMRFTPIRKTECAKTGRRVEFLAGFGLPLVVGLGLVPCDQSILGGRLISSRFQYRTA
jgi:hypothetical protein